MKLSVKSTHTIQTHLTLSTSRLHKSQNVLAVLTVLLLKQKTNTHFKILARAENNMQQDIWVSTAHIINAVSPQHPLAHVASVLSRLFLKNTYTFVVLLSTTLKT